MPELDLTVILFTVINFAIVVVLLRLLLFKPVLKVMDKRRHQINKELETAEEKLDNANRLFSEAEAMMLQKRNDASQMIDKARRSAEQKQDSLLREAREKAQALMARVENEIRLERRHNLRKHQGSIVDLSVSLAGQLIGETLETDRHRSLIDHFINALEDSK